MEFLLIKKRFCDNFFCFRLIFGVIYFLFLVLPVNATGAQIAYTLVTHTEEDYESIPPADPDVYPPYDPYADPETALSKALSNALSEATFQSMEAGAYEESDSYENKVALANYYLLPDTFLPNALLTFQIKVDDNIVEFEKTDEDGSYTNYSSSWMMPDLAKNTGSSIYSGAGGGASSYRIAPKAIQIFMPSACGEHYFYAKAAVSESGTHSYKYFCLKFRVNLPAANTGSDSTVTDLLQTRVLALENAVGTVTEGDPSLVASVATLTTDLTTLKTAVGTPSSGDPSLVTSVGKFSKYFAADQEDLIFFSLLKDSTGLEGLTDSGAYYTNTDAKIFVPFIFQALNANDALGDLNFDALKGYLVNPNSTASLTEENIKISEIMETIKTNNASISDKQYRTCFRILQRISWLQSLALHLKTKSTTDEMIGDVESQEIKTISDILGDILCFTPGVGFGPNTPYNTLVLGALQLRQTPSSAVGDALKQHITAWISDGANWTALEADAKAGIKTALGAASITGS